MLLTTATAVHTATTTSSALLVAVVSLWTVWDLGEITPPVDGSLQLQMVQVQSYLLYLEVLEVVLEVVLVQSCKHQMVLVQSKDDLCRPQ